MGPVTSEVKGVWFTSARSFVLRERGPGIVEAVARGLPRDQRDAVLSPDARRWYPEATLAAALGALRKEVAPDDASYAALLEGATSEGVGNVARALLRVSSASFVLKQIPTLWRAVRRGAGDVRVEVGTGRALIAYSAFPWFADDNYCVLTEASVRSLVRLVTRKPASVKIVERREDALRLEVAYFGG